MASNNNLSNYIYNLGKSVAYATVDKFEKMAPTSTEIAQTNSELFKEVTHHIINYKATYKKSLSYIKGTKIYDAADLAINSVFEDLQTGKLWNKDRIDKINEKMLGFNSDDMNFDFESDSDVDIDSFDERTDVSKGDEYVGNIVSIAGQQNAEMISGTIARSAKYLAENQKTSTNLLYTQNMQAYNLFNSNLSTINSNISKVINFQSTTTLTHAQNSKKYFEKSTQLMEEQTILLKQIADNLSISKKDIKEKEKLGYNEIVPNGIFDIKAYSKNIKKNLNNTFGSITSLNSMMGEDSNLLEAFVASPLQFIPMMLVNSIIPKTLEKSVKSFDNSLKGFFGSLIAKINGMKSSDNILLSTIGNILGISNNAKSNLDTSLYEKGKVNWDGKSRKALIEVIPGYLSKILSAISGKSEKIYDYDSGKYMDASSVKDSFDKYKKNYVNNASSDVLNKTEEYMKYMVFNTIEEQKKLREDINTILTTVYNDGGYFDVNNKDSLDHTRYGVDSKSLAAFKAMFKSMSKEIQLGLAGNIMDQRSRQDKDMREKELNADSVLQNIFNDFNLNEFIDKDGKAKGTLYANNNLVKILDNKGNNVFYYLQNIYRELIYIRTNGVAQSSYNTRYRNNTRKSIDDIQIKDNRKEKPELDRRRVSEAEERRFNSTQERMISKDKNIINFSNIDDEDELQKKLMSRLELENLKVDFKSKRNEKKSLVDKLLESASLTEKTKTVIEQINEITSKPMKFVVNTINKVDQRMYDLVFGSTGYKGKDVNGLFGILKLELTSQFEKMNYFIDENILKPIKDKLQIESMRDIGKKALSMFGIDYDETKQNIKDYLFDENTGLFSGIVKATKNIFKDAVSTSKNAVIDAYSPIVKSVKRQVVPGYSELESTLLQSENGIQQNPVGDKVKDILKNKTPQLNKGLTTNPEGKATLEFAKGLTNTIANHIYDNTEHYEQGGVIDKPQLATLNKNEVVLTPENVNKLLDILNDIEKGTTDGKSNTKVGLKVNRRVKQFMKSSSINDETDFIDFMNYATEDSTMRSKLQELEESKLYDKVFNILSINLEKAMEQYTKKINYNKFDSKGIPVDPIQRAMYKESEPFAKQVVGELANGASKVKDALFGENPEREKKKFGDSMTDIFKDISMYAPEAIGAGLLGGGVSLITGAIGGPLLGAAVGAGISITKKSKTIQNWLFGDIDDDTNERNDNGLIPKKYITKIEKLLPDLKTFGIAGGITGLLPMIPFGPIGGIFLGSAVAFAKNSEKVNNVLFGENGLFKPETKDKIEKMLPKAAAGAAIGVFTGPFGFLGNAAVGSAIGMLSSTEQFNKFIFGEKDPKTGEYENGLLPTIRHTIVDPLKSFMHVTGTRIQDFINDKVLAPLKDAFAPLKKDVELLVKGMFNKVGDFINGIFEKSFGIPLTKMLEDKIFKPFSKLMGGIFKTITFLPKKAIGLPFAAIGALGKSRRKAHIRGGNATYMTAEERMNFRKTNNMNGLLGLKEDKFADFDEMLVNMSDEQKSELINDLGLLLSNTKDLKDKRTDIVNSMGGEISKYLTHGDSKIAMREIYENGNINEAKKLIDFQNMKNSKNHRKRSDLISSLSNAWNDDSLSPSEKAKLLNSKQGKLYKLFDYNNARNIEKMLKDGKFKDVESLINNMKSEDDNKALDLINFITDNTNKLSETDKFINNSGKAKSELQNKLKTLPQFKDLDLNNKYSVDKYIQLLKGEVGKSPTEDPNMTTEQAIIVEQDKKHHSEIMDIFTETLNTLKKIANSDSSELEDIKNPNHKRSSSKEYEHHIGNQPRNRRKDRISELEKQKLNLVNSKIREINEANLPADLKRKALQDLDSAKSNIIPMVSIKAIKSLPPAQEYLNKYKSDLRQKHNISDDDIKNYEASHSIGNQNPIKIESYTNPDLVGKTAASKTEDSNKNIFLKILDRLTSLVKINEDGKNIVEKIDDQGNVMKFFRNNSDDLVADAGDSGTRKAISEAKEQSKSNKNIFAKFGDMFKGFIDKVNPFNKDKEKKKNSFLDGLLDKGKKVAAIAAGVTFLPQIIQTVAPIAKELWDKSIHPFLSNTVLPWFKNTAIPFLANAFGEAVKFTVTKLIPSLASTVGGLLGLSGEKGEESAVSHFGGAFVRDTIQGGRGIRFASNVIENTGPKTLKGKIAKGTAKGSTSVLSKTQNLAQKPLNYLTKKTGLKTVSHIASEKVGDAILDQGIRLSSNVAEAAAGTATKGIVGKLTKAIINFMDKLVTSKVFLKFAGNKKITGSVIAKPIIEWIERNTLKVAEKVSAKTASAISTGGLINIAWAIGDFISGYQNAENIIGITQDATLGMKITAGVIKSLNGLLLFGLIPENILVNLLLPILSPIFDSDGNIQEMRDQAKQEVAEYNASSGENLSITQYNKTVKGRKTTWDHVKEFASDTYGKAKDGVKSWYSKTSANDDLVRNKLGLNENAKVNFTDRLSVDASKALEMLTFGTVKSDDSVKTINGAILTIQDKSKEFWTNASDKVKSKFEEFKENTAKGAEIADKKLGTFFGAVDPEGKPLKLSEAVIKGKDVIAQKISDKWAEMSKNAKDTINDISEKVKSKFAEFKENSIKGLAIADDKLGSMLGLHDNEGNPLKLSEAIVKGKNVIVQKASDKWGQLKQGVSNFFSGFNARNDANIAQRNAVAGGNGPDSIANTKILRDGGFGASTANGMVYYSQSDPDWRDMSYGTGSMGSSACGPTSAAMVISSLTKQNVTPVDAAQYSLQNGFRVPNVGTSWGFFNSIGQQYGLNFNQTTDKEAILNALRNKQPVIFSGKGAPPFTKGGHFIVGAGVDGDSIKVNDPVSLQRSKAYPKQQIFGDMATAFIANRALDGSIPDTTGGASPSMASGATEPPSVFNMLGDLQKVMMNGFNRIYGFEPEAESQGQMSSGSSGPSSGYVSDKLVNYVKTKEGFYPRLYRDSGGVATIGYGSTSGPIMTKSIVTEAEATAALKSEMNEKAAAIRKDLDSKGIKLTQNEFDALVSYAYNIGTGGLMRSSLYKRVLAGERGSSVTDGFNAIKDARGNVLAGLVKRRKEEASIFAQGNAPGYSDGGFGLNNKEMMKYRTTNSINGGFGLSKKVEYEKAGGFGLSKKVEHERAGGFGNQLLKYNNSDEIRSSSSSNSDSSMTMALIKNIINVLIKIADNTDSLQDIVKLLADVLKVKIPEKDIQNVKSTSGRQNISSILSNSLNDNKVDNASLIKILNALATE